MLQGFTFCLRGDSLSPNFTTAAADYCFVLCLTYLLNLGPRNFKWGNRDPGGRRAETTRTCSCVHDTLPTPKPMVSFTVALPNSENARTHIFRVND